MKYWAPLLHIYQPPTQDIEVLKRIDDECYKPLFKMLLRNPQAKITLNINGVLIDLLREFGLGDTVDMLIELVEKGIVEIVGTAKYHPLLPLIQDKEIIRQINLNEEVNKREFGELWRHGGFFPPEMAISDKVLKLVAYEGYQWIISSGIACSGEWPYNKIYSNKDNLCLIFRDDIISNEISFKKTTAEKFVEKIQKIYEDEDYYVVTAMDGETFGHHIRDYESTFLEKAIQLTMKTDNLKMVFISDLLNIFPIEGKCNPIPSSWSTDSGDLELNIPYPLWKHPNNPVHKVQYRMLRSLDELINLCDQNQNLLEKEHQFALKYTTARWFYDRGIYSCPMWWASMRPSWDPILIYKGANMMLLSAMNAQLALTALKISDGDEVFDRFIDYHHRLLAELTKQTSNLMNIRTF